MRQLTDPEIEACKDAPQFESTTPEQLFGKNADGQLAATVARLNVVRYRQLREEYDFITGMKKRPDSFFK